MKISQISCGFGHCLALEGILLHLTVLENGNIYSWGRNDYGQLGNNATNDETKPILIFQNLKGVEKIFCGFEFSIFLQNGILWSCGRNNLGQLGLGDSKIRKEFIKIQLNHKVKKFHTSGHHSIMLENGEVFTFGNNENGQLGLVHKNNNSKPTKVDIKGNIIDIKAS
jgi:alpha-tubulin suppressor-like RCC1 family protein